MAEVQDINEIKLEGSDIMLHQRHKIKEQVTDAENGKLAEEIRENLQKWEVYDFNISKVPAMIRQDKEAYYEPSVVSIGPYHRHKPKLHDMESLKWRQLNDFLRRRPAIKLETYIEKLRSLVKKAKRCYFENIELSSDEFVKMMLLDGCYIIEFFWKFDDDSAANRYHSWITPHVLRDLCLLENQIPFFILQSLLGEDNESRFIGIATKTFFSSNLAIKVKPERVITSPSNENIHHLLHLFHHYHVNINSIEQQDTFMSKLCSWLKNREKQKTNELPLSEDLVPCAIRLVEAGIIFKMKKMPQSIFDITFHKGVIEIPFISINNSNKILLMNLVAYEQIDLRSRDNMHLSNYAIFMNCIINTGKDVEILQQSGILESSLNSEEETAKYFNMLGDYVEPLLLSESDLVPVAFEINKYCKRITHRWRARLVRDYFSSPWAIISFGAAVLLLILTFLQTFFAMYNHFHHRKSS